MNITDATKRLNDAEQRLTTARDADFKDRLAKAGPDGLLSQQTPDPRLLDDLIDAINEHNDARAAYQRCLHDPDFGVPDYDYRSYPA